MSKSPIEMMIDQSVGITETDGEVVDPSAILLAVADAAKVWHGCLYTRPTCLGAAENNLHKAIQAWVDIGG